jgi:hypothetical protein
LSLIVLAPLAWLSWTHAHQYTDSETLYRTTIERNPSAWMAYHNLSVLKLHGAERDLAWRPEVRRRINSASNRGMPRR